MSLEAVLGAGGCQLKLYCSGGPHPLRRGWVTVTLVSGKAGTPRPVLNDDADKASLLVPAHGFQFLGA